MRPTRCCLGIKGLLPLIRAQCPEAITYPARYNGLRGMRLAVDATLLVQRLHFAPDPHEKRHLIGMYRLVQTLKAHDIKPIMVFDHLQARIPQKERERSRRKMARSLLRTRAAMESRRSARLKELSIILNRIKLMEAVDRERVSQLFTNRAATAPIDLEDLEGAMQDEIDEEDSDQIGFIDDLDDGVYLARLKESEELLERLANIAFTASHRLAANPWTDILEAEASPTESIATRLAVLKHAFDAEKLRSAFQSRDLQAGTSPHASETSTQAALTAIEGGIYEALQHPGSEDAASEAIAPSLQMSESIIASALHQSHVEALDQAAQRNDSLVRHYQRASTTLSAEIFDSTAHLCTLLDVPVLWTSSGERSGPLAGRAHEAEAVASTLVQQGWADAVASEDSDVIIYEVPLLRGLMGVKNRLELVDGRQVRRSLFPPKHAAPMVDQGSSQEDLSAHLALSPEEEESRTRMLEFALLAGTDYNRTLPGIAARTAVKLVNEHGSIVNILRHFPTKYRPPDGLTWQAYKSELNAAREVFRKLPSVRRYLPLLRDYARRGVEQSAEGEPGRQREGASPAEAGAGGRRRRRPSASEGVKQELTIEEFMKRAGVLRSDWFSRQHSLGDGHGAGIVALDSSASSTLDAPGSSFGADFFGEREQLAAPSSKLT
ncbi:PIN domain-like protein [Tilletiaria anomala UBC 951]|uniref:PIN domain-like protein n=1 Tax=Tilletiaria anomala (strain ATCC 24038 / CBS 436.72 / UBC 951) TaxID=1037660 RepID=A0A066WHR0_TILAU|nr:PIN domain-like protein [Tilletiaria anomala UBC 951]KDN52063.1 PIN domain-like protein [Tilletiaria anomala UBC 951]